MFQLLRIQLSLLVEQCTRVVISKVDNHRGRAVLPLKPLDAALQEAESVIVPGRSLTGCALALTGCVLALTGGEVDLTGVVLGRELVLAGSVLALVGRMLALIRGPLLLLLLLLPPLLQSSHLVLALPYPLHSLLVFHLLLLLLCSFLRSELLQLLLTPRLLLAVRRHGVPHVVALEREARAQQRQRLARARGRLHQRVLLMTASCAGNGLLPAGKATRWPMMSTDVSSADDSDGGGSMSGRAD